ncbi:MAG: ABC transporter permease [Pseudobacteriovorax sp.]|nr:ABC transporter permease [Pseudobacteriovorax sp.]
MINFRWHRFWSIFQARNREFYRDWGTLGWVFLFPILMVIAFGYIFNLDDNQIYKVAKSGTSTLAVSEFFQYIDVETADEGIEKLKKHRVDLYIEDDKVWMNDTSLKSKTAIKLLQAAGDDQPGFTVGKVDGQLVRYVDWLFPGILCLNILWMSLWGVGWVIVRHRKLGILKRFKASPVTAFEYLLAQMTSRMLVLILCGVMVFAGAYLLNPFPVEGRLLDLLIVYSMGCFCHAAIGLIIAARMSSEELANGILNLITYPFMFISEIWFSLEGSPDWVLGLAKLTPLWHMVDGMRRIMFEGAALSELWLGLVIFSAVTVIGLTIGSLAFRWNPES